MSTAAGIDDQGRIPLAVAICCREWIVPFAQQGGSCGLCGEVPEFERMLPEEQWITPRPPIRPETEVQS